MTSSHKVPFSPPKDWASRFPADISIVGIGDFPGSSVTEPGLTTVRIPAGRIGREAGSLSQ